MREFNADERYAAAAIKLCAESSRDSAETAAAHAAAPAAALSATAAAAVPSAARPPRVNAPALAAAEAALYNHGARSSNPPPAAGCPPLGYAFARASFDAHVLENDVDELTALEVARAASARDWRRRGRRGRGRGGRRVGSLLEV